MSLTLYALTFLPMLIMLIGIHEAGHFIVGRMRKVRPTEIGLGTPPAATRWHIGNINIDRSQPPEGESAFPYQAGEKVTVIVKHDDFGNRISETAVPGWEPAKQKHYINETRRTARVAKRQLTKDPNSITVTTLTLSLNWLPLGGFVRFEGDNNASNHGMAGARPEARILICLAGPITNLAAAMLLLIGAAYATPIATNEVLSVEKSSPAAIAGLLPGDRIIAVAEKQTDTGPKLIQTMSEITKGKTLALTVMRGQQQLPIAINGSGKTPYSGVMLKTEPAWKSRKMPTDNAIAASRQYRRIVQGIASLPQQWVSQDRQPHTGIAGPVKAAQYIGIATQQEGLWAWLTIAGIISIFLGISNLLPIPPLDGYHIATAAVAMIRGGRNIPPKVSNLIETTGYLTIATGSIVVILWEIRNLLQ